MNWVDGYDNVWPIVGASRVLVKDAIALNFDFLSFDTPYAAWRIAIVWDGLLDNTRFALSIDGNHVSLHAKRYGEPWSWIGSNVLVDVTKEWNVFANEGNGCLVSVGKQKIAFIYGCDLRKKQNFVVHHVNNGSIAEVLERVSAFGS